MPAYDPGFLHDLRCRLENLRLEGKVENEEQIKAIEKMIAAQEDAKRRTNDE